MTTQNHERLNDTVTLLRLILKRTSGGLGECLKDLPVSVLLLLSMNPVERLNPRFQSIVLGLILGLVVLSHGVVSEHQPGLPDFDDFLIWSYLLDRFTSTTYEIGRAVK